MFITFEGIEGSGKSTQSAMLARYFSENSIRFMATKEPGGTELGMTIRKILLDSNTKFESLYSELLFFYIDRLENVEKRIKPALKDDKFVLCDRYIDSSYAYQLHARKMPQELYDQLNQAVDLMPDLTLVYDIEPEVGLARAENRSAKDRFEQEALDFHNNVRKAYLKQAKNEPNRVKVIHVGDKTPDEVFKETLALIQTITKV
jgi:dTMP kinase